MTPDGRSIAARVVERVARDRAFAAAALDAELARHPQLDARERGFATELAYGTLRSRAVLRERLERFVARGLDRTDPVVTAHLLVAAYQILVLDRVPPFAAVDSAVELVRAARGEKPAGFANAVLRRLAATGERLERESAVVQSTPAWLFERLVSAVGADEARALVGAGSEGSVAPTAVRLRTAVAPPAWLAEAPPGRASPLARLLRGEGDLRQKEGFAQGAFVVQEEGAQVVALALGAQPGERILDACAGRGQKASLLAEQIGPSGELFATDVHPAKLRALALELERLGLPPARTHAVDWSVGSGTVPDGFDRVLVDAPCSGVGTLRRRPEISDRLGPDDPARLARLAARILRNAASRARPGAHLVFAVCSVLPEEGEQVVVELADLLEPAPFDAPEVARLFEPGASSGRLLPLRHGTDGYFLASFIRR